MKMNSLNTLTYETIFDYYDREVNRIQEFRWNDDSNTLDPKSILYEGILYEFEGSHKNSQLYYYIAVPNKLIRYDINIFGSKDKYKESNRGSLILFFPILSIVKDKKENICGFSLVSHGQSRTFFTEKNDEILKWYKNLSNLCLLTSVKKYYNFVNIIGSGNFSNVSLAIKMSDKQEFAIKTIYLDKMKNKLRHIEAIINEIKILKMINHPNITKLYEVYYSSSSVNLVFEYLPGGELFEYIDTKISFTEENAKNIIKKLVSIVYFLHSQNIIHRDLKPENILLQNKSDILSFKLADFGLSVINNKNEMQFVRCGSPGFVAPESLNKEGYNQKADMFSIGIIAYILLTGSPPFQCESFKETLSANKKCIINYNCIEFKRVSQEALKFVKDTTQRDPSLRISSEEALNHPWLNSDTEISRKNSISIIGSYKANIKKYLERLEDIRKSIDSPLLGKSSERKKISPPTQKNSNYNFEETSTFGLQRNQNIPPLNSEFEEANEIPEELDNLSLSKETFENIICPGIKVSSLQSTTITKILSSEVIVDFRKNSCIPYQLNKEINAEWYAHSKIVKDSASRNIMSTKESLISINKRNYH